jgi:hypothetical protein
VSEAYTGWRSRYLRRGFLTDTVRRRSTGLDSLFGCLFGLDDIADCTVEWYSGGANWNDLPVQAQWTA